MKQHFITITSALLVFLWVYTAIYKLVNIQYNIAVLKRSPFLNPFAYTLSVAIPATEIIAALVLLQAVTRQKGLWLSLLLLLAFSFYITAVLLFASWSPCTCGGIIQSLTWHQHLAFNAAFMIITAFSIKYNSQSHCNPGQAENRATE